MGDTLQVLASGPVAVSHASQTHNHRTVVGPALDERYTCPFAHYSRGLMIDDTQTLMTLAASPLAAPFYFSLQVCSASGVAPPVTTAALDFRFERTTRRLYFIADDGLHSELVP